MREAGMTSRNRPSGGNIIGLAVKAPPTPFPGSASPALGRQADCIRRIKGRVVGLIGKVSGPSRGVGTRPVLLFR